jgi:transposase
VLAVDETDLRLFPPLRAGWARRGEPARVVISGHNARRVVFGALNLRTGARLFAIRRRNRAEDFQAFLKQVRAAYRGRPVALLLDEHSAHTARESVRAAAGLTLLWLPSRSPELNPLETLWGQAKDVVSANKRYVRVEDQADRFVAFLRRHSNRRALETSGVLSDTFWLRDVLSKNFCVVA